MTATSCVDRRWPRCIRWWPSLPVSGQGSGNAAPAPRHHRLQRRTPIPYTGRRRRRRGAIRTCRAPGPATTRRSASRATRAAGADAAAQRRRRTPHRRRPQALYLSDEQFAARQKQILQGITNAENAIGTFRSDFARRAFRQTSHRRRSARRHHAADDGRSTETRRAARPRHVRRRPVRLRPGLHALRPLHHARHLRLGAARHLRQRQPHRPGAGHGGHQLRDDPRHARHLHGRPPAHRTPASASISATRAAAGKATSSSSRRRT